VRSSLGGTTSISPSTSGGIVTAIIGGYGDDQFLGKQIEASATAVEQRQAYED